jgi:hypothetical protein
VLVTKMSDDPDDENEAIASYVREQFAKQRGRNDFFDYSDKSTTELEVARTALEEADIPVTELRKQPVDCAPDCLALLDQEPIGIEVTELVSQDVIERYKRDGTVLWRAWSKDTFLRKLKAIIARKDQPNDIEGGPYSKYFLVVHTDEFALKKDVVEKWLEGFMPTIGLLDEVLLLLSYEPETKCCPVIRIPVQKKATPRQPT